MNGFDFVTPPAVKEDEELNVLFSETMTMENRVYEVLQDRLSKKYVETGVKKSAADKAANEDARFVLPNAATTRMIVTMNARSLLHLFKLMLYDASRPHSELKNSSV